MNITNEQKVILSQYGIRINGELNELLLSIDAKITELGFDSDYALNEDGLKLQQLYDDIYYQNE